jgi:hypothetical protein
LVSVGFVAIIGVMKRLGTLAIGALVVTIGIASSPARSVAAAPATTVYNGAFSGAGTYTGSGKVIVVKSGTRRTLKVASNFKADRRSIRLRMYLATDATGKKFVDLGALAETGAQSFRIPASVKISTYRYAIAWCAAVNEPIAKAKLIAGA